MNVTVKNIPDRVGRKLKDLAANHGRSLNAEIIQILQAATGESERRQKMRVSRAELERFVASLPPMPDSAPLIRADRRSR